MLITDLHKYLDRPCRGAIHVGANVGEERDWYNVRGFKRVLWFEPNLEPYTQLEINLWDSKIYGHHVCLNLGIHDSLMKGALHIANNRGQSSSLLPLGTHSIYHPEVTYVKDLPIKLIRLDEFFELTGRDIKDYNFLNVDVQGTELNVLRSLGEKISQLDYIYTEVNEEALYVGCSNIVEIDFYLARFGFVRAITKMTKAHWGDALYTKTIKQYEN